MRAVLLNAPGERIAQPPCPRIGHRTDAVVRVVAAGICGTNLRAYAGRPGTLVRVPKDERDERIPAARTVRSTRCSASRAMS